MLPAGVPAPSASAPEHLAAVLVPREHARENEEQVGQSVQVLRDLRGDGFRARKRPDPSFGPARDGAREVARRRRGPAARQDEVLEWWQVVVEPVERLLETLDSNDHVVVLDSEGQPWTSQQLAQFVGKHLGSDPRRLTFVIGGYGGISAKVKARADRQWSLSRLTFTHEMTRLLVVEQLYRALCILNNHPYSK